MSVSTMLGSGGVQGGGIAKRQDVEIGVDV
jgi:hypothetical protein